MAKRIPRPGDNPRFDAQVVEARDARAFIESPVWAWLKAHLSTTERRLILRIANPTETEAGRLMLIGKLALVTEILERPEELVRKLNDLERTPEPPAPFYSTPGAAPATLSAL